MAEKYTAFYQKKIAVEVGISAEDHINNKRKKTTKLINSNSKATYRKVILQCDMIYRA